jgi:phage repressor protein C with HTH and peptisase S24 domain
MAGAYVLVQLKPPAEGEPPLALIKRLVRKAGQRYVLEQFNPARQFEVPVKDVVSIHRVVGSGE